MSRDRTAVLQYLFHRKEQKPAARILGRQDFRIMGWDTKQYQIYAMNLAKFENGGITLQTKRIPFPGVVFSATQTPVTDMQAYEAMPYFIPHWVKQERYSHLKNIIPYSHYAGGLCAVEKLRPTFRVQVVVEMPYAQGLLPCPAWLAYSDTVTEEFDLAETNARDIWMAHNFAKKSGWDPETRDCNASHFGFAIKGRHTIDLELTRTEARWYLDGRRVKTRRGMFNFSYFLFSTMIVTQPYCPETEMKIHQISIDI